MASEFAKLCVCVVIALAMQPKVMVLCDPKVPCLFFFGDSQFDNGNNNNLKTYAKANYYPYGIDYGSGNTPTGRFSNGKNIADYLGEFIGFPYPIPSWASTIGNLTAIANGVNYASGGAGILDKTGDNLGQRFTMKHQLINHASMIPLLRFHNPDLQKCLYIINIGSNDYINNYFLKESPSSSKYNPDEFANMLISEYSEQLKKLYYLGARKIVVFNLGVIGCIPQELVSYPPSDGSLCVDSINSAVNLFNTKLKTLITQLNTDAEIFTYIDAFAIAISGDPASQGFTVPNAPCCTVYTAKGTAIGQCKNSADPICSDRSKYIFFDNYHPTARINLGIAYEAFTTKSFAYPHNISNFCVA